ncbi:MAG: DUF2723 domain-containing protein [Ignavibacteriales bacterium]|nr:DUF2723 domain-containing protein [Ignavibacteriales bacterium]
MNANHKPQTANRIGAAISLFAFFVYFLTANRTASFIDAGELATVATTLGIAHPTGYPLFTLLSYFVTKLPLGIPIIFQLNLFAAFLCSVGLFFFFKFLVFFTTEFSNLKPLRKESFGQTSNPPSTSLGMMNFIPAICGTLLLAFSETYWSQAVAVEVYSLHVLFLSLLLLFFTKAIHVSKITNYELRMTNDKKYFLTFSFVLGLSFTNHLTTILLAPAFLFLFFKTFGFNKEAWKKVLSLVLPFLLGLSVYLYLPIRSSQNPMFDWGHPATLERFLWHVRGKQFSVWIFSSMEVAKQQFSYFVTHLPAEFAYIGFAFGVIGIFRIWKDKRALWFTSLLFIGCVLYSINYDIKDIDSYFLLAYFVVAIWSAFGVLFLQEQFGKKKLVVSSQKSVGKKQQTDKSQITNLKPQIIQFSLIALCLLPIPFHYSEVDESKNFLVEDYTKNILNNVENDAIIISYQWDYFISASYYFQTIDKYRPDVTIIDKELLRRTWYFPQLERHYPSLIHNSRNEINTFLVELNKFEHNEPYNNFTIEQSFRNVISSFITKNMKERAVYVTPEIEAEYTQGFQRIPDGLLFRLVPDGGSVPIITPKYFSFRPKEKQGLLPDMTLEFYVRGYANQAMYFLRRGEKETALKLAEEALKINPAKREALFVKQQILRPQ